MFKLTCKIHLHLTFLEKACFIQKSSKILKQPIYWKSHFSLLQTIMLLKMLTTRHSIRHISCIIFNYIPCLLGCGKLTYLMNNVTWSASIQTKHFVPQSIILRKPKITDTFREPIQVTETKWHIATFDWQGSGSWTILCLAAISISVRALTQAEKLTNHTRWQQ